MKIKTVMIIDDNEGDQLLSKREIENFDPEIKILQAYDGQEALEILTSLDKQPEAIFVDINMPRMNGLQFLEAYEKLNKQGVVVAMLTSSELEKELAMSYDFVKHYFVKRLDSNSIEAIQNS